MVDLGYPITATALRRVEDCVYHPPAPFSGLYFFYCSFLANHVLCRISTPLGNRSFLGSISAASSSSSSLSNNCSGINKLGYNNNKLVCNIKLVYNNTSAPSSILAPASAVDRHSAEAILRNQAELERMFGELKQAVIDDRRIRTGERTEQTSSVAQVVLRVADIEQGEIALARRVKESEQTNKELSTAVDGCKTEFRDKCTNIAERFAGAVNNCETDLRGKLSTIDVRLTNAINGCTTELREKFSKIDERLDKVGVAPTPLPTSNAPDISAAKTAAEIALKLDEIARALDEERKIRVAGIAEQKASMPILSGEIPAPVVPPKAAAPRHLLPKAAAPDRVLTNKPPSQCRFLC